MGRKLHSKKRKIKDVSRILEHRNNLLKDNINAPPSNADIQSVPRSLKDFVKLKMMTKMDDNEETSKKSSVLKNISKGLKNGAPEQLSKKISQNNNNYKQKNSFANVGSQAIKNHICKKRTGKCKKNFELRMKRKTKLMKKKLESEMDALHNDVVKDVIEFGEVVHKPPEITVRPRKAAVTSYENRPGRKDDLLLKSILKRR